MIYEHTAAEQQFSRWRTADYEGMMYRQNTPYGLLQDCTNQENRWDTLLKRKDWLDEECEIVGVQMGTGKYTDCVDYFQIIKTCTANKFENVKMNDFLGKYKVK